MSFIRLGHLSMGECDPDTGQCLIETPRGTFRWTGGEPAPGGGGASFDPFAWFKEDNNLLIVGAGVLGAALLLRLTGGRRR